MANVNAAANSWNCPNYTGELFLIGANQTPFLNMIGGLQGNSIKLVRDFQFPLAQPWALEAPSQPDISENSSLTAPTPWTYVRSQDVNTCQMFHRSVSVSYAKSSVTGQVTADPTTGLQDIGASQPVADERDWQVGAHMRQIALNSDYTFLNGQYQQAINVNTSAKTRGVITAATTNTVNAAGVALSKELVDTLLRTMAGNGAEFINPVIFVNAFQKVRLSNIYGNAPDDRNVGGVNIKMLETDFAQVGIVWAPNVPAATLLVAEMSVCAPVFLPVPNKGVLFYEDLAKDGAADTGQIYGQIGIDYGPEEYHGTITNLATS